MIREGSVAKDLSACIKVLTQNNIDTQKCMMVTDDAHPMDLTKLGHLNFKVKRAIEEGVDPVTAIQMVSLNTARHFRIDRDVGGIAPGKFADILVVDNLRNFNVEKVFANGKLVAEKGRCILQMAEPRYPPAFLDTMHLKKSITPRDLMACANSEKQQVKVKVLGVFNDTIIKDVKTVALKVKGGVIQPDVSKDALAYAVVERHKATGNVGRVFLSGFGIREGAIGSSVNHDNHNISVVGTNFEDMAVAVNTIAEAKGGMVAVKESKVLGMIKLPIFGILADTPLEKLTVELERLHDAVNKLGCKLKSPFMTMSFISCAIPKLLVSDKGYVDPIALKRVDLVEK
jgi:adenine deaminase